MRFPHGNTEHPWQIWSYSYWLVVQCAHLEKYEFVNGKDYPIYEMKNKNL